MAFDAVVLKVSNEEHIFFIFRAEVSLTMGAIGTCKTFVTICYTTLRHDLEDYNYNFHCPEELKSHIPSTIFTVELLTHIF
jgi:hypothetical protein